MGKREDFRKADTHIKAGEKLEAIKTLLPYKDDERVAGTLKRLRAEVEAERESSDTSKRGGLRVEDVILLGAAALILAWGLMSFFSALDVPNRYALRGASAPQIAQVYSEAAFQMAQAAALFALSVVLLVVVLVIKSNRQ